MKTKRTNYFITLVTLLFLLTLNYTQVIGQTFYGLSNGKLYFFKANKPESATLINTIWGVLPGQRIVGMDFRPNTGELFALGYNPSNRQARLYIINVITAGAKPVGSANITLNLGDGNEVGFDFNPTVDRIRVVAANRANFRLNPNNGAIAAEDGRLAYNSSDVNAGRTPRVVAGAYTNSYIGTATTTLYNIEAGAGVLVTQNPPNDGILNTVGSLGLSFGANSVVDIDIPYDARYTSLVQSNPAYLVVGDKTKNSSILYWLNLSNGATAPLGTVGIPGVVEDIAILIERRVPQNLQGNLIYAVTTNNNLISFDSGNPGLIRSLVAISGIATGQTLVGTDFRPNTGELFGLGYNSANGAARLYTINLQTGVATAVGTSNITLDLGSGPIGFDFNPTVDRIRVESSNQNNYRLNPITGGIAATDGDLKFATGDVNEGKTPFVGSVAYTNSFMGSTATTLYVYDDKLNILATQIPPNDGVLNTIGASGITVNTTDFTSDLDIYFDGETRMNTAYLVANNGTWDSNFDSLYTLNLQTGATTGVGRIGNGIPVRDIAVFLVPMTVAPLQSDLLYAISTVNGGDNLISFTSDKPDSVRTSVAISGIAAGQTLVGTDFRPNTGELFGLGYNSTNGEARLYTINLQTGVASAVGAAAITLDLGAGAIGFDFNPTVDRIRVEGANQNNYRLNPITGGIAATDGDLKYAVGDVNAANTPAVGSAAYTNSFIGTATTTLYVYDDVLNILATQIPPNDGVLNTIGASGITQNTMDATSDLDIFYNTQTGVNTAYFVANVGTSGSDSLYTINLTTGALTRIGRIAGGVPVRDIAAFISRVVPDTLQGELVYAVTTNNNLISFDSRQPQIIRSLIAISGITTGQTLVGTDFRPNTGELFGLGYNSTNGEARLYTINLQTGVASAVGAAAITLDLGTGAIGFDFNPTVDRIRVEGANQNNYRLNPITGGIAATDGDLKYAVGDVNAANTPAVGSVAYTNSFIGTTSTTLYVYDDVLNILATQIPPNDGVLNTIGTSGITQNAMDASSDLDITFSAAAGMNIAYLSANTTGNNDSFYTVNLASGAATLVGQIGAGIPVRDIAVFIDRTIPNAVAGQLIFGWTANNLLITFDSETPEVIRTSKAITGLPAGQLLVGMDFRPATGELWAMSYNRVNGESTLFTLDTATAVLTSKSPTPFTLDLGINASALIFDFNPTVDRIRVMGENGRNYRLNPLTGGLAATDGNLKYASGDANAFSTARIGSAAYINSFNTAATTTLFDYDVNLNILASQVPPNDGLLNTIGASGITVNMMDPTVDLDIFYDFSTTSNLAYLAANVDSSRNDNLYSVNLQTGAVTLIGRIGNGIPLANISIQLDSIVASPMIQSPLVTGRTTVPNFVAVPNPGRDEVRIQLNEEMSRNGFTVQIADLRGQIRMRQVEGSDNSGFFRWDASQLTAGTYLITVTYADGRMETQKWMKQ